MDIIHTLIVDDEKPARRRLLELLESKTEIEIVALCPSGAEAIKIIRKQEVDLVFLDIQMSEIDGFQVIKTVGLKQMPFVIFVTAYDQYALQAFEAHAIDYLLKPYSDERFETALERAKNFLKTKAIDANLQQIQTLLNTLGCQQTLPASGLQNKFLYLDRLVLKSREKVSFLKVEEIIWIEAAGVYIKLHTSSQVYLQRGLLGHLEKRLDPQQFIRIHRSAIVNINYIKEMLPDSHGEYEIVLQNKIRLRLSRTYKPKLQTRLGQQF